MPVLTCPKCKGRGKVSTFNPFSVVPLGATMTCNLCDGAGQFQIDEDDSDIDERNSIEKDDD